MNDGTGASQAAKALSHRIRAVALVLMIISAFALAACSPDTTSNEVTDSPAAGWPKAIRELDPISVYTHNNNTVVVLDKTGGVERGKYITDPKSSYLPQSGDDGFTFTAGPVDGSEFGVGRQVYDFERVRDEKDPLAPTVDDGVSPSYWPDAPVRDSVGEGHVLVGRVVSSETGQPIKGARLELWPEYAGEGHPDAARATVFTDPQGDYRFECDPPEHIHMRVSASGYVTIGLNSYHPKGASSGRVDIVLRPQEP